MSIEFGCQCGKRLKVAAELAGKQVRCPGCSDVLTVPQQQPAAAAGSADRIMMTCQCGQQLRVKSELAGKRVRCSACQQPVLVPGGPTPQAAPVATPQAAPIQAVPVQQAPIQAAPIQAAPIQASPIQAVPVQAAAPAQAGGGLWDDLPDASAGPQALPANPAMMHMTGAQPAAQSTSEATNRLLAQAAGADSGSSSGGGNVSGGIGQVSLGILMIVGGVVWFVVGWFNGYIFYKGPPFLVIGGMITMVKGFVQMASSD